jgi:GDP-L-fucose synthase
VNENNSIYVAGGATLVGAAIIEILERRGFCNIKGKPGDEPDLTDSTAVEKFFSEHRPEYVFVAAGNTGGIQANSSRPAELMLHNLHTGINVIESSLKYGAKKLLYLASSCSYPRVSPQPIREEYLLNGPLEPTNEAYAVAKIAGLKLCQACRSQYGANFITGIPANVFGPGDDFDPIDSHVIPAMILKMHNAKISGEESVPLWGTGSPKRDFIFSEDLADACVFVMQRYDDSAPINLSADNAVSISELAGIVREIAGFRGELVFDTSKPDGMPIKTLDGTKLRDRGWSSKTPLTEAIKKTYKWFLTSQGKISHD